MEVEISKHAHEKIAILREHGVTVTEKQMVETVLHPTRILDAWEGRAIAESILDGEHILRVVYIKQKDKIRIITTYPARRDRY